MLEYVTIIILYAAATQILDDFNVKCEHRYPVIDILSDNTSAVAWTRKASVSTAGGKALGKIMCLQMMNNTLGLHSHHIAGSNNDQADFLSRLTTETKQDIFAKYPNLAGYKQYRPGRKMICLIWRALLLGHSPEWNAQRLKGSFDPGSVTG